jgi:transcriptional regulator
MYIPRQFQNTDDAEIKEFIRTNGFGILINQTMGKLWGTHIPLVLSADGKKLTGHVSKANPQWKYFVSEKEVMAIFNGPHAYISSSWYDHENVPTWNYIAVHVYGKLKIIQGEELLAALKEMVDQYETSSANPVSVEKMSPQFLKSHIDALVGFEIEISNVEAAYKLSQNRDRKNHDEIVRQLEKRDQPESNALANEMKKFSPLNNQK